MVDVNLPVVGMAVLSALAYVLYGILRARANGTSIDVSRVLPVVVAAVFLAIVAPELIPADPGDVFLLPVIALTAFTTFGALFVFQRLYEVALAIYWKIGELLGRLQIPDEDLAMRPKVRARKPKPKQNPPATPS